MFFKLKSLRNLILCGISCFTISCGLKVNEPPKEPAANKLADTECLNTAIDDMKLFFAGKSTEQRVELAFNCLSKVLIAFKDNVNGANRDFFEAEELAYFVETQFLKGEHVFSKKFLDEIVLLKFILVGGPEKVISKEDILRLSSLFEQLGPQVAAINSEMVIINGKWDWKNLTEEQKEKRFQESKVKLSKFFDSTSKYFEIGGKSYEAKNLFNLIKEIAIFAKADPLSIDRIEKIKPFIINFKKYLVGHGTLIRPSDWKKISRSLHEFLFQFLRISYFLDHLTEEQQENRWKVYQDIASDFVQLFSSLLSAQDKPVLSSDQIYDLISSVMPVFSDQKISQQLIDQLALIKAALIGGSSQQAQNWTPNDLDKIRLKLPQIFVELQKMIELLDQLKTSKTWTSNHKEFEKIEVDFNNSIKNLSLLFDGPYSIHALRDLLVEIEKNKLISDLDLPDDFESYIRLVTSLKFAVTGEPGAQLTALALRQVLQLTGQIYFHYLEYTDYIEPYSYESTQFYFYTSTFFSKIEKTILSILNQKKNKQIENSELIVVFKTLQDEKFLKWKLSSADYSILLTTLWKNVLISPERRLSGESLKGFNAHALSNIMGEIRLFIQNGSNLAYILQGDNSLSQNELVKRLKDAYLEAKDPYRKAALEMQIKAYAGSVPHIFNQQGFLEIFAARENYKPNDMLMSSVAATISRILIRSFSKDLARVKNLLGVTLAEAQSAFDQVRPLLVNMEILDPANTTFMASRYREANLFVSRANGDNYANYEEIHDLALHILSGLDRSKLIESRFLKTCKIQSLLLNKNKKVKEDCLVKSYLNSNSGFEGLPVYTGLKLDTTEEGQKMILQYYQNLLIAAGHITNEEGTILISTASLYPHIVQYVEMLFYKYDRDRDGILTKDEALVAFPVFKQTIKDVIGNISGGSLVKEKQYPGVFIYLLKYGRPPKTTWEKLDFLSFVSNEDRWDLSTTRYDMAHVFRFISEALSTP